VTTREREVVTLQTVGVRELKAHLSQYIRAARAGERVVITERGREVAQLTAISREEAGLRRLVEQGLAEWSGEKPDISKIEPVPIKGGPISDTVLEQRGPR
jgi:prevent-host-death family protein